MDKQQYKKSQEINTMSYKHREELRNSLYDVSGYEFQTREVSLNKTLSKNDIEMDRKLMDINASMSELDMSMISQEFSFDDSLQYEDKSLSDLDFLIEESEKMQEFLKDLRKTGSVGDNEILSSMESLLEQKSQKIRADIGGGGEDEKTQAEKIQKTMEEYHGVRMRLLELSEKYLQTDKYWMTRSGYRKKDLCQKISKWATKGDALAAKWESVLVSRKENEGVGQEIIKRNKSDFEIVKDRLNNEPKDETLTKEAKRGIHEIDAWILKHTNFGPSNDGFEELQVSLMRMSDRERMYVYYLIETGKRKAPDELDISLSQINYVPSPEKFKSAMISKKLWKGFSSDSRILWNKLSDAILAARKGNVGGTIKSLREQSVSALERTKEIVTGNDAPVLFEVERNEVGINADLEEKYKRRNDLLGDSVSKLQQYKKELEILNNLQKSGKKTGEQQKKVDKLFLELTDSFYVLDEADKALPAVGEVKEKKSGLDKKESIEREQTSGDVLTLLNAGAGGATAVDKVTMAKDYVQWGFIDKLIKAVPGLKAGTGALAAVSGFTAVMLDISLLVKLGGEINATAVGERLTNLTYVSSLTATYAINAAGTTVSYLKGVPVTDLTQNVSKHLAVAAGVTAVAFAAVNIAEHVGISKRTDKITRAEEALTKRHEQRRAQAEKDGTALSQEEIANERIEKAMITMEKRMEKNKRKVANANSASAGFLALSAIPVAGMAAAAAGVAVATVASIIIGMKGRKVLVNEVVDSYIKEKFDQEYLLRYGQVPGDYSKLSKKEKAKEEKRRKSVENYICAGLGYSDKEKLLAGIQREMATYLHGKLFYRADGSMIYKEDLENPSEAEELKPYMDAAYGLGLKIKHPNRPGKKGGSSEGKPSPRKIYLKMKF